MAKDEALVYGRNAALAVARHRPDAILRVFFDRERKRLVGPLCKAAAAARKPYREVEPAELEKIASTVHHEGVVVVTRPLPLQPFAALREKLGGKGIVVAVDEVGNPHNLGAILRSAAWFGAGALLFGADDDRQATLSASAVRVAQGGAEVVPCCAVADVGRAVRALRKDGFDAVCADPEGGDPPDRIRPPVVLVVGNEGQGVRPDVREACNRKVSIPGSGAVESLNVSVATGILLAFAARPTGPPR